MVTARTALQGRNVYGSGSYAPTKGRVSAQGMQGYLQRSVRNISPVRKVGGDGQSDTRSGLAAQANARRQSWQSGPPSNHYPHEPYQNEGRQNVMNAQQAAQAAQQSAQMNAMNNAVPTVTVNANGQLELPYSPEWSQELLQSMGDYNQNLAQLQADQQNENLSYGQTVRNAGIDYGNQQRNTLNNNAGAGTAFSSAYGVQASNDANIYQNQLNDLLAQHQAQAVAFDTERTALINAFKAQMQQASLARAEQLAQEAGTLGYGQEQNKKKPGRNTSAHQQGQNKDSGSRNNYGPKNNKGGKK